MNEKLYKINNMVNNQNKPNSRFIITTIQVHINNKRTTIFIYKQKTYIDQRPVVQAGKSGLGNSVSTNHL